jgi:hypothetical protein
MRILFAILLFAITSCGGGGNSTVSISSPSLKGVVAVGAPVSGAQISLIDANGTTVDGGVTGSDGSYTISSIGSLTPPLLISATATIAGRSTTYYSVLTSFNTTTNIANVTPITDAALTQAVGKSLAEIANTSTSEIKNISATSVTTALQKIVTSLSDILNQITSSMASSFDPIKTEFVADGKNGADKINDLISVNKIMTASGVEVDLIDKSNSVGVVTVTSSSAPPKLPKLPDVVISTSIEYLGDFIKNANASLADASSFDGNFLTDMFDSNYKSNCANKTTTLSQIRGVSRSYYLGAKLTGLSVDSCSGNICQVSLTATTSAGSVITLQDKLKLDTTQNKFLWYGNQSPFKATFESSYSYNPDTGVFGSGIVFKLQNPCDESKYQSGVVTLQSGNTAPDFTQNLVKKAACPPTMYHYNGLPFDDGNVANCGTSIDTTNNQALVTQINEKINQGNYLAVFTAHTSINRSDVTPDVYRMQINKPISSTIRLNADAFPKIVLNSGTGLPCAQISNADDFSIGGTLCISADTNSCTYGNTKTTSKMFDPIPLFKKYCALASDGWVNGDTINKYYFHVIDKAGRDLHVSNQ